MRRFLYYFPGAAGTNARGLADRGVLDRFTNHNGSLIEHAVTPTAVGPDEGAGRGGCLVAAGNVPAAYEPQRQRWTEGAGGAGERLKVWVGIEDVMLPPAPSDLQRDVLFKGYEIMLGDSNMWRVPCIRHWDAAQMMHVSGLPQSAQTVVGRDGRHMGALGINPRYLPYDQIADRVWLNFMAKKTVPLAEAMSDVAALLGMCYRVGVEEIGLLGLVDGELLVKVLGLCVDSPALETAAIDASYRGLEIPDPVIDEKT